MNAVTNVIARLTPPPFVNPVDYDGLEFKWRFLAFRPAYFQVEVVSAFTPLLTAQFSKPLVNGVTSDGYTDFFTFSTGRKNVQALHTIFTLKPRHDLFQYLFQILWGLIDVQYNPVDDLQLDFTLAPNTVPGDFVWAAVAKSELRNVKKDRWDLSFTKTTENPLLPNYISVMSEFADVTDAVLKTNLATLLAGPNIQPYFRSVSITDQPRLQPEAAHGSREKHLILSLVVPSKPQACLILVSGLFTVIDNIHKVTLRPETKTKLRKARDEVDKKLKEAGQKEKVEEALEDKRAAKKRAEEERISKLSAAEQQKYLDRERKREMRKSQGKTVRK
ncbi:hypothetical protein CPB85DRAFT_520714 [Mucidula mucida]|nr:hypothetical protein CPB85DRAFT_520714 [Mucidula mucida]